MTGSDAKKKVVDEFVELVKSNSIVGAVNMEGMPAKQLQAMREKLRGKVHIRMTKRRLLNIALDKCKSDKKGIEELKDHLKGMPALLFTDENPFTLFKTLEKNKSSAPAKAGQTAPNDIVVQAGPTSFSPGPIIGELGALGIKAGIENGKVAVKENKTVVKEGDVVDEKTASILSRLGVTPMEIGLGITAVYEDGTIFTKDVLRIDEKEYTDNLVKAHTWSINLAMESGFLTDVTTPLMLSKAHSDAVSLGLSENILEDEIKEMILAKAHQHMAAVSSHLPEDARPKGIQNVSQPATPEVTEEPKKDEPEEKKEDAAAGLGALFG